MNDQTQERWDVELEDAPVKSGVPVWVWGCGGGCLLLLVAAIGGTLWFGNKMVAMFGPDAAWPVIAEIMPYAEEGLSAEELVAARPAGYTPVLIPLGQLAGMFGSEEDAGEFEAPGGARLDSMVVLSPDNDPSKPSGTGLAVMLFVFDGKIDGDPLEFVVDTFDWNRTAIEGESDGRSRRPLQGREVDSWHLRVDPDGSNQAVLPGGGDPQSLLFFDITAERDRTIVLACVATGEADATVAGVEDLLLPFDVWGGR